MEVCNNNNHINVVVVVAVARRVLIIVDVGFYCCSYFVVYFNCPHSPLLLYDIFVVAILIVVVISAQASSNHSFPLHCFLVVFFLLAGWLAPLNDFFRFALFSVGSNNNSNNNKSKVTPEYRKKSPQLVAKNCFAFIFPHLQHTSCCCCCFLYYYFYDTITLFCFTFAWCTWCCTKCLHMYVCMYNKHMCVRARPFFPSAFVLRNFYACNFFFILCFTCHDKTVCFKALLFPRPQFVVVVFFQHYWHHNHFARCALSAYNNKKWVDIN